MNESCKNHPDREAKRRCFHCKSLICAECQIQKMHHIYCGWKCIILNFVNFAVSKSLRKVRVWYRFIRRKKIITPRNLIEAFLVILIFYNIILVHRNQQQVNELIRLQEQNAPIDTSVNEIARHIDTLTVFQPPPTSMIVRNRFDIEGETEENRVITLSANGKLQQAILAKGRRFYFEDVVVKNGQNHFVIRSISEDGNSVILEEIEFKYGRPTRSILVRDFSRGSINERKIALTFDGGYLDNAAHDILDILKQENVKATLFLTGIFIRKYPELVKRMADEDHVIGNHTWTHPHLTSFAQNSRHETLAHITAEVVQQELLRTAELFRRVTGREMAPLWRAPYGEHNPEIRRWAADVGFRHIGWTMGKNGEDRMDTMDWVADKDSPAYYTAEEIAEKILSFGSESKTGANGSIILMHLGSERDDDYPHLKLPMVIDQLKKRGYELVTVPEML
ncbi:polysaccharide deacetylase family protein [candidate division KSB1 bacterium]|nr:polysaccharide deacetylase family protein [candidate division KSB1 bacterium]